MKYFLFSLCFMWVAAFAQPRVPAVGASISEYRLARLGDQTMLSAYLAGMVAAYTMSNARLQNDGARALFCAPAYVEPLTNLDARRLIDEFISRPSFARLGEQTSTAGVLLQALREAYPCATK